MNYLCLTLYLSLLLCFGDAWVTITRDEKDYRTAVLDACGAHTTSGLRTCTCKEGYNTMISRENSTYYCSSPFSMGCYLTLQTKQTYLVTEDNYNETKQILGSTKIDPSDYKVYIWNLRHGETGDWYDITEEASKYFHVSRNETSSVSSLATANLNMDIWKGQLMKITFGRDTVYQKCLTLKVKGALKYPFKLNDFKGKISTHSSTGAPTGTKTTTASPETTIRKTTMTTTIRKTTMTESTESVKKKSTPTSKSGAQISPKKNTKYIIAVPVLVILLVVLVVAAVILMKRRTKSKNVEIETGQEEGMKPGTISNPIITVVKTIEEESTENVADACV